MGRAADRILSQAGACWGQIQLSAVWQVIQQRRQFEDPLPQSHWGKTAQYAKTIILWRMSEDIREEEPPSPSQAVRKKYTIGINVNIRQHIQAVWKCMRGSTQGKNCTTAFNVNPKWQNQETCKRTRRHTLVKSQRDAQYANIRVSGKLIWKFIWCRGTQEKDRSNVSSATLLPPNLVIWKPTWELTWWRDHSSATSAR